MPDDDPAEPVEPDDVIDTVELYDPGAPKEPWHRRAGETGNAYVGFMAYCEAGPTRSLRKLARDGAFSFNSAKGWSVDNEWVVRALSYDRWFADKLRREQVVEVRAMAERHVQVARTMQAKALRRLQDLDASELSPSETRRWFEAGVAIERLARGEPVETFGEIQTSTQDISHLLDALDDDPALMDSLAALSAAVIDVEGEPEQ